MVGELEWFIEAVGFEGVGDVGIDGHIGSITLHGCLSTILLSEIPHTKSNQSKN